VVNRFFVASALSGETHFGTINNEQKVEGVNER
jgi:hypothetical protein